MDVLRREAERKRKAVRLARQGGGSNAGQDSGVKYRKIGQIQPPWTVGHAASSTPTTASSDRPTEKEEREAQHASSSNAARESTTSTIKSELDDDKKPQHHQRSDLDHLTPAQITRELRKLRVPVRLFGERTMDSKEGQSNDAARLTRLRRALEERREQLATWSEKDEFRLGQGHGIRNTFLQTDKKMPGDNDPTMSEDAGTPSKTGSKRPKKKKLEVIDDGELESDPHKKIYRYFKGLLTDWEKDLAERSEGMRRSIAGKNETMTLKQCKDYIRPLFKLCKNRSLEEGLTANLIKIVDFCRQGEFVKANDAYMDVAIGRAAWPIGVTMVGIHARSGRAKIESQNVAHVMNSELQRKYLTSIKRLMTYAQSQRPDLDPSKKVVN